MRAAIDSASSIESRPARWARNANSPRRASRASKPPARAPSTSASAMRAASAGAPTQEISSESSPVKLAPDSIQRAITGQAMSSLRLPELVPETASAPSPDPPADRSRARARTDTPRRAGSAPSTARAAARTPGPDARTSARTPRPGGEAMATIVVRPGAATRSAPLELLLLVALLGALEGLLVHATEEVLLLLLRRLHGRRGSW